MKRILNLLLALLLLSSIAFAPFANTFAHDSSATNLINNPSVETAASASTPQQWITNAWGTNTANFSYLSTGSEGTRSVRTDVTSYTDGDAKWYFESVSVEASTNYAFGEFYRSNTATEVVIQYTHNDNSVTYQWLVTAPAVNSWTEKDYSFTTPSTASKLTVFHVVASVGWLELDNVALSKVEPQTVPPSSSLVPNESVETASASDPNTPAKWLTNSWGTHSASFEYANDGKTGSKSVKTIVSNYTSGDSKWYFEPILVTPNTEYVFSDFYKSSVVTHVVAVTYDSSGNPTYQDLVLSAPASPSSWQALTKTFTTPSNAATLSIFHVVESNGWLQIDDLSVKASSTTPPQPGINLITNPSFETGSGTPQAWLSNNWGANSATFVYESTGRTGNKSVKTTVSSYADGDAKWYFEPVTIASNTSYTYSHYYKANAVTGVVAQFTDQSGANTYQYLATLDPSSDWKLLSVQFITPASARKVSIFHVVASVGQLTIDDAFMTIGNTLNPSDNPVPNNSLETANGNAPDKWLSSSWGTNNAGFQYVNEGKTGSKSVKVTVSNYQSGDAKWYFEPIRTLERGSQYRFSAWYKTNTTPHPVVLVIKDDGTEQYLAMPDPVEPADPLQWQFYTDTFSVPVDAQAVSVFFYVNTNGWVQTDDYSITPHQVQGFNRPLVTLTFDDGHEQNTGTALPVMQSFGFKSTQCYATTFIEDVADEQAVLANAMQFKNAGHEICSHTVTHPFLTQLSAQQVDYELSHSKDYLQSAFGVTIRNFASPYGDHNAAVNQQIQQYYRSHRTVNEGYNSKDNFDVYRLRVQNMLSTTTLEEFQSWLDHAKATNTWLILVYHKVDNTGIGSFDTFLSDFQQQMGALSASGIMVKTYNDALDEVIPQL